MDTKSIDKYVKGLSRETRAYFYEQAPYKDLKNKSTRASRLTRDLQSNPDLLAEALDKEAEVQTLKIATDRLLREKMEALDKIRRGDATSKKLLPPEYDREEYRRKSRERLEQLGEELATQPDAKTEDEDESGVYKPKLPIR